MLLAQVPQHKSLYGAPPGVGLPIGSLTSQFFANVYLNELDQFVKHTLGVRAYLRYVDDFVLLADNPQILLIWKSKIEHFLHDLLRLELHPGKVKLQRCNQGIDFLGSIVFPDHRLVRQRSVRALRRRLAWFKWLVSPHKESPTPKPPTGRWQRWLSEHQVLNAPEQPTMAFLTRMLSTINSYYGIFGHANTWRLRKHIFQNELGPLRTYFIPEGPDYRHLQIRQAWLPKPSRTIKTKHKATHKKKPPR
nr:RNA-directed DNA polymerase [Fluviibacter phosphoraccumulans]